MAKEPPVLCYFVNVDWYFDLHWLDRAKAAILEGYIVHVVCGSTSSCTQQHIRDSGVVCHPIFFSRGSLNPFSALLSFIECYRVFRQLSPDIIVSITLLPCIYAGFYSKIFKKNIVFSIAGTGWIFSSTSYISIFLKSFVSKAFRFFSSNDRSFTIFENPDDRSMFLEKGMCRKASSKVISGAGVNTEVFVPKVNPYLALRKFTFLFGARLLNSKGLDTLISAGLELHNRGYEFHIDICGIEDRSNPDSISFTTLESWCSLPFVRWLGHRNDMAQVISEADVAVLPTRYGEGVPRFLIEAASCGLPCIATAVSGCRDIVLDNESGFLIEPGDSHGLSNRMLELMSNPELVSKFKKNARDHVLANFDQELVISETLSVYKSLLI